MKVLAFISQKGGSGKTNCVVNLAVHATLKGLKVLVVDLDPQASATVWYRARKAANNGEAPVVLPTHQAGLPEVIAAAREQGVDWLLIDTAAGTDASADLAVEAADAVVIPCRPLITDLRAIPNSLRLCRSHQKTPHVVLSQIPAIPRPGSVGALDVEARKQLKNIGVDSVLPEQLTFYAAFYNSQIDGRAAIEYEPKGKGAEQMQGLFSAVQKKLGATKAPRAPRAMRAEA